MTEQEKKILRLVPEELHTSVALIRDAASKIWAVDAPRIVQDYTDHGIHHSERLADYASRLISGKKYLESIEAYVLLCSIYLHDIGMQCDVNRHPSIKERAVQLGAKFDLDYDSETSNSYSVDQQKEIRKNHHYLSIAWLDFARKQNATVLATAAMSIPDNLVADLLDVCVHHTKLPITSCKLTFTHYPGLRKQLVAALLRFSDELDIESRRVSIETVKNFAIDPSNSVFWWLHNSTTITFKKPHLIHIGVALHPHDTIRYGSLVQKHLITEFRTKNSPVISVLAQNRLPIVIDDESKVASDEYRETLPVPIALALEALGKRLGPLEGLVDEVRTWLRAIRYEVNDPRLVDKRTTDLTASLDQGTVKQRILVRCIGGEISEYDVIQLDSELDRRTPQGWLLSDRRVSENARDCLAHCDAVELFTLSEFLRQKVWGPYFQQLESLVEQDRIPELYVDIGCYKILSTSNSEFSTGAGTVRRQPYQSLDETIDLWLTERGRVHISLLGEFGSGKTWFCRHYAWRQLKRYLSNPSTERLPLLITLRHFTKATTARDMINDALAEQYKLPFVGTAYEVFSELNRRGKILLILDGFDEMARKVDYQTVVDNFWELASLVDDESKVILTSRTEYFRQADEAQRIFGGGELGRKISSLRPPEFEVLFLQPFTSDQIRRVITGRVGTAKGNDVADQILDNINLKEMASKPVLVELLLAALEDVDVHVLSNPAQVYLYATNKLLFRNIQTQRTFTTTADKLYFLCELAWEMIRSNELRIHYKQIPDRIKSYFGSKIRDQGELDNWDYDLRNQTLLRSDMSGYYEFAHKSLAEYFVAFKFASELGCLSVQFQETYTEADNRRCSVPFQAHDLSGSSIDAIKALAKSFGAMPLSDPRMRAIGQLLSEMIDRRLLSKLWEVLKASRDRNMDISHFNGGNAATLLKMCAASFSGKDLSSTNLMKAELAGADLAKCDLSKSDLRGANLFLSNIAWEKVADLIFEMTIVAIIVKFQAYQREEMNNKVIGDLRKLIMPYNRDRYAFSCIIDGDIKSAKFLNAVFTIAIDDHKQLQFLSGSLLVHQNVRTVMVSGKALIEMHKNLTSNRQKFTLFD